MTMTKAHEGIAPDIDTLVEWIERFVRERIAPHEPSLPRDEHGAPTDPFIMQLREEARAAGLLTPHIRPDGSHRSQRESVRIFRAAGLSPLGPPALNVASPDEGNMFMLAHVAGEEVRRRYLEPLVQGKIRSAFFMTEPAEWGGAGSDPSMLRTRCERDGDDWVITGRKAFITGVDGAAFGILLAGSDEGPSMFVFDLPDPAVRIRRLIDTIDSSMPGGHGEVDIDRLRVPASQMIGRQGEGFRYAQVRLAPARLSHCARWLGACRRAHEIACAYACERQAFGKALIDHGGVGFMLAENLIDLQQAQLMVDWCADALDAGRDGNVESSIAKVAVSEGLMRVADRCVQVMGGMGVSRDTIVEQVFREIRAFRIYDGPTEVHKWSLAKKIKRNGPWLWAEMAVPDQ
jgi:acyl-CoA dehydrogenase